MVIKTPRQDIIEELFISKGFGGKLVVGPAFSHFLTSQTPSEDDNSEDEWLEPLLLEVEGHWAKDLRQTEGSHGFQHRYSRTFMCFL